ncbi:hypothetical protein ES703_87404 [subsurface metagenome]
MSGFDVGAGPANNLGFVCPSGFRKCRKQRILILGNCYYGRQFLGGNYLAASADNACKFKTIIFVFGIGDISYTGQRQLLGHLRGHLGGVTVHRLHSGDYVVIIVVFQDFFDYFSDGKCQGVCRCYGVCSTQGPVGQQHHFIGTSAQAVSQDLFGHRRSHS